MNLTKVKEALAELKRERELLEEGIRGLQNLIANLERNGDQRKLFDSAKSSVAPIGTGSYVDLAVNFIQANDGQPVHVNDIVEHIRKVKGKPNIKRQSVEATFFRHITDRPDTARLVKAAPGMYGLKRYPRTESAAGS